MPLDVDSKFCGIASAVPWKNMMMMMIIIIDVFYIDLTGLGQWSSTDSDPLQKTIAVRMQYNCSMLQILHTKQLFLLQQFCSVTAVTVQYYCTTFDCSDYFYCSLKLQCFL